MFIIDFKFFAKMALKIALQLLPNPVYIYDVGKKPSISRYFVILIFFFKGTLVGKPAVTVIQREVHVVNNLQPNMLLGINVFGP